MSQFDIHYIRKFKHYQLQTMMRTLGLHRSLLHDPVDKLRAHVEAYALSSPDANQRVWNAYHAIKNGATAEQPVAPMPVTDDAVIVQRVLDRLGKAWDTSLSVRAKSAIEELARELRKDAATYRKLEVVLPNQKPKKLKARQHTVFERVLQLASQRVNVLLVGPAGCGKTFLGAQVAESLGYEFSSISCSAGMSESQLAGWLLPTGKAGQFEYSPSPFVKLYETGGVFLLDEIDSADPNTMTFMNKALANTEFYVPQRLSNPRVKKHKSFVAVAAANTFGNGADVMYVGRNQLDAATMDRFRAGTVMMGYDPVLEQELVHPQVLEWGVKIRSAIEKSKLRRIMSTRVMLDLTKMTEAYKWDRQQWEVSYFADWSEDERRRVAA